MKESERPASAAERQFFQNAIVQPIEMAIAIQIDHGVGAALAGRDIRFAKTQMTPSGCIEPPFASAVLPRHLQIEEAVLVGVGREANLRRWIRANGFFKVATTVVEQRQSKAG